MECGADVLRLVMSCHRQCSQAQYETKRLFGQPFPWQLRRDRKGYCETKEDCHRNPTSRGGSCSSRVSLDQSDDPSSTLPQILVRIDGFLRKS